MAPETAGPHCACGCTDCGAGRTDRAETYRDGLRAAQSVVERQTDLADLVHFDRPSDFRKGVLTCLAALDAAIRKADS